MKKNLFFGLALMFVMGLAGLVYESAASAQNSNSSTTSMSNKNSNMGGRRHRRHWRRHARRHRRGGMGSKPKNANQ